MEENKDIKQEQRIDEVTNAEFISGHDYDGIEELDNEMPGWWRYIFYFSIIFAIGYIVKYHVLKTAPLQDDEYLAEFGEADDEDIAAPVFEEELELFALVDEESLAAGNDIYTKNCAVCHLQEGQGQVGPNLTDEYWIHGGSFNDVVKVITDGVPVKGMIAWKNQINATQIHQVASYIYTLKGTNPPNPKDPEGEKYEPEADTDTDTDTDTE